MLRRLFLATATAVLAATAMTPVALSQDVTLRMWTFLNPDGTTPRDIALKQIIEAYEAANPGTRIEVETQAWDQMSAKFLAGHGVGSNPDIVWLSLDFIGEAIRSGSVADLNALAMQDWTEDQFADRAGRYWDLTSNGDEQYALFTSRNYISLIYRPDLFAEAGIDPNAVKTWDDFLEAAKTLTVKGADGQVVRYGFAQGFSEAQADPVLMIPMMLGRGDTVFTAEGKAAFATEAGIDAMTFQRDLVTEHGVMSASAVSWTSDDVYEQFASDRAAMIVGASVRISTLQAKMGADKVGMMLMPGDNGEPSPGVMAGWAVGVWSGGPNKEAAADFVTYMLGPDSDMLWAKVGGQTPVLTSTLTAISDFVAQPGNEYLSVAVEGSSKHGWLPPITFPTSGYRQALSRASQRVIIDNQSPEEALRQAEEEFNRSHDL